MRILMLTWHYPPAVGGTERMAERLVEELAGRGHEIEVWTARRDDAPPLERMADERAVVRRFFYGIPWGPLFGVSVFLQSAWCLWRARRRFDVVHSHQASWGSLGGAVARRLGGAPILVMVASSGPLNDVVVMRRRKGGRLLTRCLRWADLFIALCRDARREMIESGLPPEAVRIVHNGLRLGAFLKADDATDTTGTTGAGGAGDAGTTDAGDARTTDAGDAGAGEAGVVEPTAAPTLVYVGRLHPIKGVDLLLRAFADVRRRMPGARLIVVGDGPARGELERLADELGLPRGTRNESGDKGTSDANAGPPGCVSFVGAHDDPRPFYRQADAIAMPSRTEGMSNVMIEAMASACPIVATAVGGNRDLLDPENRREASQRVFVGDNGILVAPEDAEALTLGILEILRDADRAKTLAHSARRYAETHCAIEAVADQYEALYRSLSHETNRAETPTRKTPASPPLPDSPATANSPAAASSPQSFGAIARRRFLSNRLAVAGLIVVLFFATVAVWCPLLATNRPYYIRTLFLDDYENAYYSALDLMGRLARLGTEPATAPEATPPARGSAARAEARARPDTAALGRLLLDRLRDIEAKLVQEDRVPARALREEIRTHLAPPRRAPPSPPNTPDSPDPADPTGPTGHAATPWEVWSARLEALADPEHARLLPATRFPAIRSLHGMEVFFLMLWLGAVWVWASGFWRRGGRIVLVALFVPALVGGVAWRMLHPPVVDTTDYRSLIERPEAPVHYWRAPVPYGENENLTREANQPPTWLLPPERRVEGQRFHALGTDPSGRDVLARMVYGARISMLIGIVAVSIFVSIGILVGATAGYFRGWVDIVLSRIIEIVICFPTLFLLLILLAYIRPNIYTIMAALGLISWTGVARLERGEFLRLVNQDFVQAVRALGGGPMRIIFRHILPNALGPVLVSASFGVAGSILAESTLSFLGFGVPPDQASWGGMLKIGNDNIKELWWMVVFPGTALFATVTCFNLVGEGVRDATDPRLMR